MPLAYPLKGSRAPNEPKMPVWASVRMAVHVAPVSMGNRSARRVHYGHPSRRSLGGGRSILSRAGAVSPSAGSRKPSVEGAGGAFLAEASGPVASRPLHLREAWEVAIRVSLDSPHARGFVQYRSDGRAASALSLPLIFLVLAGAHASLRRSS